MEYSTEILSSHNIGVGYHVTTIPYMAHPVRDTSLRCWFGPSVTAGAIKCVSIRLPFRGCDKPILISFLQQNRACPSPWTDASTSPTPMDPLYRVHGDIKVKPGGVSFTGQTRLGLDGVNPIYGVRLRCI